MARGRLIAFEGLDQSGKQTQAERLRDRLIAEGRRSRLVSFPEYTTSIGQEISRALHGEREYGADVMQLLLRRVQEVAAGPFDDGQIGFRAALVLVVLQHHRGEIHRGQYVTEPRRQVLFLLEITAEREHRAAFANPSTAQSHGHDASRYSRRRCRR